MHSVSQQLQVLEYVLNDFLNKRKEVICCLRETAEELDEHYKNIKITKVVTESTGIVGTILGLIGLALAIPTGGISLALTVGGGALAATSAVAHLGSDIAKHILTKSHLKKLDELCQADYLEEIIRDIQEHPSENKAKRKTARSILEEISGASNLTCSILRVTQAASLSVKTVRLISTVKFELTYRYIIILCYIGCMNNREGKKSN